MKQLKFTDVTLREAAHNRECNLSFKEMIELAKVLDRLNVDIISLAQINNEKIDSLLVRTIATAIKKSCLSIPVGYTEESVDIAWSAISEAKKPRLYVEAPMSAVQMEYICGKKPSAVIEMIKILVKKCCTLCHDVEFAAIDATRGEAEFLYKAIATAIEAGAETITICDSAGIMMPYEFGVFIENVYKNVPELLNVKLAVKCSDELSMGAACAISAVKVGAEEIDVIVAGNRVPRLETAAAIIRTRGDDCGFTSNLRHTELHRSITQLNWLTASKHSSTKILNDTFSAFGNGSDIMLSASDDISAVSHIVNKLGYDLSDDDMVNIYETFKNVVKKKSVGVKELEAIIATSALQVPPTYELVSFVINSGNIINATANIHCRHNGEDHFGLAVGDGPIDAAFLAIEQMTGHHYDLDDFQIQAVTEGREAMGSTLVKLRSNGKLYSGNGISTDIIGSSIRAYINALNKISYEENH